MLGHGGVHLSGLTLPLASSNSEFLAFKQQFCVPIYLSLRRSISPLEQDSASCHRGRMLGDCTNLLDACSEGHRPRSRGDIPLCCAPAVLKLTINRKMSAIDCVHLSFVTGYASLGRAYARRRLPGWLCRCRWPSCLRQRQDAL